MTSLALQKFAATSMKGGRETEHRNHSVSAVTLHQEPFVPLRFSADAEVQEKDSRHPWGKAATAGSQA